MYPHERSLVEELKDEPFALIGVNSDSVETAKKAIEKNGLNWRSFQNSVKGKSKISADWVIEGWPTVVILDADMKIRYRGHDGEAATEVARELLAEMEHAKQ
jgi:peroxiredoxin